jgi:hypothetical protein
MDNCNAPPPRPTPNAAPEAIAAAQQAPEAPPSSAKRPAALTFDSSNKRPTASTSHTKQAAAPFLLLPSTSSAAARTPSTTGSFQANKDAILNNGFFKWAREPHINLLLPDASNDSVFVKFRQRFHRQTTLRFKEQRQTSAIRAMAFSSQPRTRSEAQAILEDTDRDAFNLECTDARRLSRLHLEDIFRQLDGTPLLSSFTFSSLPLTIYSSGGALHSKRQCPSSRRHLGHNKSIPMTTTASTFVS